MGGIESFSPYALLNIPHEKRVCHQVVYVAVEKALINVVHPRSRMHFEVNAICPD